MSQLLSRLFEKWLNAGGDLTYSEWLAERREVAERMRTQRPGTVIKVPAGYFQQQALLQNSFAMQQQAAMQGTAGLRGLMGALLG